MKVLTILHAWVAHGFYTWAAREIPPLHRDVPKVTLRQRHYEERLRTLLA